MYMHTLDSAPAAFSHGIYDGEPYIHFVGGRNRGVLVASLRQIRREQQAAIAAARRVDVNSRWAMPRMYGYVLVEVPR